MRIESSFIQIPGVGESTERDLWARGITEWAGGIDPPGIGPKTDERICGFADRATGKLTDGDVGFFATQLPSAERWRLLESFRDRAIALDIETTGLDPSRDVVTTVTLHGDGETRTLVREDDLTRSALQEALEDVELLLTYNGVQFDVPFLEQRFDLTIDVPHVDLRYPCHRIGWEGGLKRIERTLGIERSLPAVDGREAIRLWHRYERGDRDALDRLVRYNREDTRTLLPIADRLVAALDSEVFAPYVPESNRGERTPS